MFNYYSLTTKKLKYKSTRRTQITTTSAGQKMLHVWIASHIGNQMRLKTLQAMITSLDNQKIIPNKIIVSISSDIIDLHNIDLKCKNINLTILKQQKKLLQFEHLHSICQYDKTGEWIIFCDDDDLCSPTRISNFIEYKNKYPKSKAFCSTMHYFYEYVANEPYDRKQFKIIEKFSDTFQDYTCTSHNEFGCLHVHIDLVKEYFEKYYQDVIKVKKGFTDCNFFDFVESYGAVIIRFASDYAYRKNKFISKDYSMF